MKNPNRVIKTVDESMKHPIYLTLDDMVRVAAELKLQIDGYTYFAKEAAKKGDYNTQRDSGTRAVTLSQIYVHMMGRIKTVRELEGR